MRIKDLGLEVKAGDDILIGNSEGTITHSLLVIDPDNDEWLLLSEDDTVLDKTIDSPRLHDLFDADINSLTVTLKEFPGI